MQAKIPGPKPGNFQMIDTSANCVQQSAMQAEILPHLMAIIYCSLAFRTPLAAAVKSSTAFSRHWVAVG